MQPDVDESRSSRLGSSMEREICENQLLMDEFEWELENVGDNTVVGEDTVIGESDGEGEDTVVLRPEDVPLPKSDEDVFEYTEEEKRRGCIIS